MIILVGTLGKLNGSGYIKDEQLWLPQAIPGHEEACGYEYLGRPSVHWWHGRVL